MYETYNFRVRAYCSSKFSQSMSELDTALSNSLLRMYGKCGSIRSAENVFKHIQNKNTISWNILISFYAQNGSVDEAFQLFHHMYMNGVKTDIVSFVSILSTCIGESKLGIGRLIHGLLVDSALELESV